MSSNPYKSVIRSYILLVVSLYGQVGKLKAVTKTGIYLILIAIVLYYTALYTQPCNIEGDKPTFLIVSLTKRWSCKLILQPVK